MKANWEKDWIELRSEDILQEGDAQRYVLAYWDEEPTPIQKHFIGLTAWNPS